MTIKKLTKEHYKEIYDLNVYAFSLKDSEEIQKWMANAFENGLWYGSFSDGQLKSSLIIFPFDVYYHGSILKMGGIGNVSSYPEVRGEGSVRRLMETALKEMKNRGIVISYLAPFSYRFYRKFGYEVTFEERRYELAPSDFGSFKVPENRAQRVLFEDQKEAIMAIYQQKMEQGIGPLKRQEWVWERRIMSSEKKKIALYRDDSGVPQGYLLYEFKGKDQNTFHIDELIALTGEAEKALWRFIGTHASSFNTFIYNARSDQQLTHVFQEADVDQKITSSMMTRIVDMENFLKQFPFEPFENQEFWLEVTDDTAEWNNKLFKLSISGQEVSVAIEDQAEDDSNHLKASIQTWTQLFMQFKKAEDLQFEGLLSASKETARAFQNSLPQGVPELYDYF